MGKHERLFSAATIAHAKAFRALMALVILMQGGVLAHARQWETLPPVHVPPKEVRGYKVERVNLETHDDGKHGAARMVKFGEARLAGVTPFGITLEIPLTVAPVKQRGEVDFLIFEDVHINGYPVTVEEYRHHFRLPDKEALTLPEPARVRVTMPRLLFGAYEEWSASKEVWNVTGRVYVCGRYKKFIFTFKRAVLLDVNLSIANPIREHLQRATLD